MTLGSLFTGIGGFDIAAHRAGIETIWQVENEEYCIKILNKNFPHVQKFQDIKKTGKHNLESVDIISGGFPCQDISFANRKGKGIQGPKSGLWKEFFRIIREIRPEWVIIENVTNLFNRGFEHLLNDLASIGYDAEWHCIQAAYVGAAHRRDRLWIIANSLSFRQFSLFQKFHFENNLQNNGEWSKKLEAAIYAAVDESEYKEDPGDIRINDGLSKGMDGFTAERIRALGNSLVPEVPFIIFNAIKEIENDLYSAYKTR